MTEDDTLIEGAAGVYITLIELIGIEATIKIYETFRGQEVFFPKRFLRSDYIALKIMEGWNYKCRKRKYCKCSNSSRNNRNRQDFRGSKQEWSKTDCDIFQWNVCFMGIWRD